MNRIDSREVGATAEGPFPTLFFRVLVNRPWPVTILGICIGQALLTRFNLPAWSCVFYKATGLSCPGCGMSRSIASLLKGDIAASWSYHPFAFFYVIGAAILAALIILPKNPRTTFLNRLRAIDTRLGITIFIIGLQVIWGIWRIVTEVRGGLPHG